MTGWCTKNHIHEPNEKHGFRISDMSEVLHSMGCTIDAEFKIRIMQQIV